MVFYLDKYILAAYFLLFYEMWGFPNKWCEKNMNFIFLDFMISHIICIIGYKLTTHNISSNSHCLKKIGETAAIVFKVFLILRQMLKCW